MQQDMQSSSVWKKYYIFLLADIKYVSYKMREQVDALNSGWSRGAIACLTF